MPNQSNWRPPYEAALREADDNKLNQCIAEAIRAIYDRLEDALHGRQPLDNEERRAIQAASQTLRSLKQQRQRGAA